MAKEQVKYSLTADRIEKALKADPEGAAFLSKYKDSGLPWEGEYDFGGNLEGAIQKFGEEVIYKEFKMAVGLWLGGIVRDMIEAGKNAEEIQTAINTRVKGITTRKPKKSANEQYLDRVSTMSPEEKKAQLKALEAEIKAMS